MPWPTARTQCTNVASSPTFPFLAEQRSMSRQIAFFRAVRGRAFEYDRNSLELCSAQVRAQSSFGFWRMRSSALLSCAACPQGTDRPLRSSEWHLTWIDGVVEPGLGLDGRPRDCVGATALAGSMRRLHRFQIRVLARSISKSPT